MRIVIVEDEASIREGMEGILKKLGDSFELAGKAANGLEGLELIRREKPDLIIMDIRMPDMDGLAMLGKLRKEGYEGKALVLSAYSDFSYARKAMELGVDNYLLKPVRLQELKKALTVTEQQLEEEQRQKEVFSPESMMRSVLTGILRPDAGMEEMLAQQYGFGPREAFSLLEVWLGKDYDIYQDIVRRILGEVDSHSEEIRSLITAFPESGSIIMVLYAMEQNRDWEDWFDCSVVPMLLANTDNRAVCAWSSCEGFARLEECRRQAGQLLEWNLTVGNTHLLSEKRLNGIQVYPFRLPPELPVRTKQAVIRKDRKEFTVCLKELQNLSRNQVHSPREIKESCITFLWSILNTVREYVELEDRDLEVRQRLEDLMKAVSWEEIGACIFSIFNVMEEKTASGKQENSPLVRRAKRMIEEYYSQGITLEEVARKLSVTPEYLSRQYRKETGRSFTEEVRGVRVEKVKTLLLGTDLNMTQIAAMTGFSDPKYMSKVFKEEMGMLPADYRQENS